MCEDVRVCDVREGEPYPGEGVREMLESWVRHMKRLPVREVSNSVGLNQTRKQQRLYKTTRLKARREIQRALARAN